MKQFILLLMVSIAVSHMSAYDFQNGNLYYNILPSKSDVEVTYDVKENASYKGVIHIPATVENEGKTYNVTSIGDRAFYHSGVTDIHIPNNIKQIGEQAFYFADKLNNITLPLGLKTLSTYILSGTNISGLAIPDGVKDINTGALQACPQIRSLFIPSQVTKVGSYGFYACHGLAEIYCLAETPPDATAFAVFQGLTTIDIIVPDKSVDTYNATAPWNTFSIYPSETFEMAMTVQGVNVGDYDVISLGDSKAYKIYDGDELIAVTAAETYYLPNNGIPKTYKIVPTNYFFDDKSHNYTTIKKSGVNDIIDDNDKVTIYTASGNIYLNGELSGKNVSIYDVYGNLWYSAAATPVISIGLPEHAMYIVRCGTSTTKIIL
ncbi:MAG: leucine-rich repeat domain-containing protein [Muribaculaceae bacterium]